MYTWPLRTMADARTTTAPYPQLPLMAPGQPLTLTPAPGRPSPCRCLSAMASSRSVRYTPWGPQGGRGRDTGAWAQVGPSSDSGTLYGHPSPRPKVSPAVGHITRGPVPHPTQ